MIIAGESSGELYGSLLSKALKSRNPGLRISGVGGERMASAGVELISTIASSFGVIEAIRAFGKIKKTFKSIVAALTSFAPQVVVLIDYPDFNIPLAREAKKRGIKVLYYVSPQVWAWRPKRIATIGKLVDAMAVILPFEVELYKGAGIPCEFVGHPIMDEIAEVAGNPDSFKSEIGLQPDSPVMVMMPGSRPHEVRKLLPVMAGVAAAVKKQHPDYQFVLPVAPNLSSDVVTSFDLSDFRLVAGTQSVKALMAADIAVIASGTATLQAALLDVPIVVLYKLPALEFFLAKRIVKVKHVSLANILLDKSVSDDSGIRIKELLQNEANEKNVMREFDLLSGNKDYKDAMISQMEKVRALFVGKKASVRVAGMIEQLLSGVQQ